MNLKIRAALLIVAITCVLPAVSRQHAHAAVGGWSTFQEMPSHQLCWKHRAEGFSPSTASPGYRIEIRSTNILESRSTTYGCQTDRADLTYTSAGVNAYSYVMLYRTSDMASCTSSTTYRTPPDGWTASGFIIRKWFTPSSGPCASTRYFSTRAYTQNMFGEWTVTSIAWSCSKNGCAA